MEKCTWCGKEIVKPDFLQESNGQMVCTECYYDRLQEDNEEVEQTDFYCLKCGDQNVEKKGKVYRCYSCNFEWNEDYL